MTLVEQNNIPINDSNEKKIIKVVESEYRSFYK